MTDIPYAFSLLGLANLIELFLLAGGFIAVCIASTGYAQLVDSYANMIEYNGTRAINGDMRAFYDIDAYMIKKVDQSILMILFGFTFLSFLGHILFAFRYRYTWHRISIFIGCLCVTYACALLVISILVACWEDKLRKRLTNIYLSNEYIQTPNGFVKPNTGSAAAAAAFGFAACLIFLSESLIRFHHLADKIQA